MKFIIFSMFFCGCVAFSDLSANHLEEDERPTYSRRAMSNPTDLPAENVRRSSFPRYCIKAGYLFSTASLLVSSLIFCGLRDVGDNQQCGGAGCS